MSCSMRRALLSLLAVSSLAAAYRNASTSHSSLLRPDFSLRADRPSNCPPCPSCFNCNTESDRCLQYATCNKFNGKCSCPPGFGGDDCALPLCGALPDGDQREPRAHNVESCECAEGWGGINCNVCLTDRACDAMMPADDSGLHDGGVCYKQPLVVKENFQMCDVTNPKIVEQLKDQKPQVTFSCEAEDKTCNFQFWVAQRESFYCTLDTCTWTVDHSPTQNITEYRCEHASCSCIPDRMLCGEDGSADIGDFLDQKIRGPATFRATSTEGGSAKDGSEFREPEMDQLIGLIFGDDRITLDCNPGECLYRTEVPGYAKPVPKINTPLIAGVIAGAALFVVAVVLLTWYLSRRGYDKLGAIYLDDSDDETARMLADHKPAALQFQNVSYQLNGKQILQGVQGIAHPGQIMAIMGASGAGKTTFLDILARKNKRGAVNGDFYVNGELVSSQDFRAVIGFVDQEDAMLPTLTVHETIRNSAMLRLPRDMPMAAKENKVNEVERQLGIYHIRDQLIGSEEGKGRGISGGEKRRVGIACELVTSPSILFLDEPTSGLDAFNAFNVIECLVNLARTYQRTIIFTIHQPRSNIVSLFDQLVLLARGRTVYSGPFAKCQAYFDSIGFPCPPGFNIADYLVDLTMHASTDQLPREAAFDPNNDDARTVNSSIRAVKSVKSASNVSVEYGSYGSTADSSRRPPNARKPSIKQQQDRKLYTRKQSGVDTPDTQRTDEDGPDLGSPHEASQQWLKLSRASGAVPPQILDDPHQLPPPASGLGSDLDALVANFADSSVSSAIHDEIATAVNTATTANGVNTETVLTLAQTASLKAQKRVGLVQQFLILSQRTWKNLYRNPMLMLAHYAIAILVAVLCGYLFYGLTNDIMGFQDRLGLLFFILALFGFSTLTSLTVFSSERLIFLRERANGYYAPVTYFASKVVFDIVPLRLLPPIILTVVVYPMTGLVARWPEFWTFMLVLVLFNLAAAAICLLIGILCRETGLANLIGSLVMLFSLLFAGFLLNKDAMPTAALWLRRVSIFHYGLEALLVNEMRSLSLYEHKFKLDIEVPGASILSAFGFEPLALWTDVVSLAVMSAVLLVLAYAAMHFLLVEKR